MKLSWSSAEMRQICISQDGLTKANPTHADEARLLLSLLSGADDLSQVRRLRCVRVRTGDEGVRVQLGSVVIEGSTLDEPRSKGGRGPGGSGQIQRFCVQAITIAGRHLVKSAS